MSNDDRENALKEADTDEADGCLTRHEFMDLCVKTMWDQPLEDLESASNAYTEYKESLTRRNNTRWRAVADKIDRFSRFWFLVMYLATYLVVGSLTLQDDYIEPRVPASYVNGSFQNTCAMQAEQGDEAALKLQREESKSRDAAERTRVAEQCTSDDQEGLAGMRIAQLPVLAVIGVLIVVVMGCFWCSARRYEKRQRKKELLDARSRWSTVAAYMQRNLKKEEASQRTPVHGRVGEVDTPRAEGDAK